MQSRSNQKTKRPKSSESFHLKIQRTQPSKIPSSTNQEPKILAKPKPKSSQKLRKQEPEVKPNENADMEQLDFYNKEEQQVQQIIEEEENEDAQQVELDELHQVKPEEHEVKQSKIFEKLPINQTQPNEQNDLSIEFQAIQTSEQQIDSSPVSQETQHFSLVSPQAQMNLQIAPVEANEKQDTDQEHDESNKTPQDMHQIEIQTHRTVITNKQLQYAITQSANKQPFTRSNDRLLETEQRKNLLVDNLLCPMLNTNQDANYYIQEETKVQEHSYGNQNTFHGQVEAHSHGYAHLKKRKLPSRAKSVTLPLIQEKPSQTTSSSNKKKAFQKSMVGPKLDKSLTLSKKNQQTSRIQQILKLFQQCRKKSKKILIKLRIIKSNRQQLIQSEVNTYKRSRESEKLLKELELTRGMNNIRQLKAQYHWSRVRSYVRQRAFIRRMTIKNDVKIDRDQIGQVTHAELNFINLSRQLEDDDTILKVLVKRDSSFFILWETVYAIAFVLNALCIPYWVSTRNMNFMPLSNSQDTMWIFWINDYFFLADMIYNCVVQHQLKDEAIKNSTSTIKESSILYFKNQLLIDLISNTSTWIHLSTNKIITDVCQQNFRAKLDIDESVNMSFSDILQDLHIAKYGVGITILNISRCLYYLKFMKIARIYRIMSQYENFIQDLLTQKTFQSIRPKVLMIKTTANVLAKMAIVVHLVTCFWMSASDFGLDEAKEIYQSNKHLDNPEKSDEFHIAITQQAKIFYLSQIYLLVTTVSTVGYGDDVPDMSIQTTDRLLFIFTMNLGILFFCYLQGQLTGFMKNQAGQIDVQKILDEKEYGIKRYMVEHNSFCEKDSRPHEHSDRYLQTGIDPDLFGPRAIDRQRLDLFIKTLNVNFKYNVKHAIDCDHFRNLTPHLKEKLLMQITFREQLIFEHLFINADQGYEMPQQIIRAIISSLEYAPIEEGSLIVQCQEQFNHFYMIKMGTVQVMDRRYGYMYSLEQGSFFGEQNIIFGLYSEQNYKAMTTNTMIFKIRATHFMTLVCEDHKSFENLFWISVQRQRYNQLVTSINYIKRDRAIKQKQEQEQKDKQIRKLKRKLVSQMSKSSNHIHNHNLIGDDSSSDLSDHSYKHGHCHGGEHNNEHGHELSCGDFDYDENQTHIKLYDVIELQATRFKLQNPLIQEFYDEMRDKRIKKKEIIARKQIFLKQPSINPLSHYQNIENTCKHYHSDTEADQKFSQVIKAKENIKQMGALLQDKMTEADNKIRARFKRQETKLFHSRERPIEEQVAKSDRLDTESDDCEQQQVKQMINRFMRKAHLATDRCNKKFERKKCELEEKIKVQIQKELQNQRKSGSKVNIYEFEDDEEDKADISVSESCSSDSMSDEDLSQFSEFAKQDFTYDINSDDQVEAKCVVDYGTPKYLGNQEDMEKLKRKQSLIHQINYASFLEIELYKLNIKLQIQQSKANSFVTSLNTDVIEKQIQKISQRQKLSMMKNSIIRGYQNLERISQEESKKQSQGKTEKVAMNFGKTLTRIKFNKAAGLTDSEKIDQMQLKIKEMQENIERRYQAKQNILKKIIAIGRAEKEHAQTENSKSPLIQNISRHALVKQTTKTINSWQRSQSFKHAIVMEDDEELEQEDISKQ